jgi:hypothetical protein
MPGQYPNPQRISSQDQPINLASTVQVSIDTAVQSCEVRKSVGMITRVHELTSVDLLTLLTADNGLLSFVKSVRVAN